MCRIGKKGGRSFTPTGEILEILSTEIKHMGPGVISSRPREKGAEDSRAHSPQITPLRNMTVGAVRTNAEKRKNDRRRERRARQRKREREKRNARRRNARQRLDRSHSTSVRSVCLFVRSSDAHTHTHTHEGEGEGARVSSFIVVKK